MNDPSNHSGGPLADLRLLEHSIRTVFEALGSVPHMFVRRGFGTEHFGFSTGLGIVFYWLFFVAFAEVAYKEPFGWVFLAWIIMQTMHRIRAFRQDRDGDLVHSRYNGWPILCDLLPIRESTAKSLIEPIFIMLCSSIFFVLHAPILFVFFTGAGFAGAIASHASELQFKAYIRKLRNAEIEQQVLMDEYERQSPNSRF